MTKGQLVIPGAIDPHVHLPSSENSIRRETRAAACGGVTTIVPFWTSRSLNETFSEDRRLIEQNSLVDMALSLNITAEWGDRQTREIPDYARNFGVTSFKFQPAYRGEEAGTFGFTGPDYGLVFEGFTNVARIIDDGYPGLAMFHAENFEIIERFRHRLMREGKGGLAAWTESRPGFAEEEAMRSAVFLAGVAGARLYIVHMTGCDGGSGVDFLARAKAEGAK